MRIAVGADHAGYLLKDFLVVSCGNPCVTSANSAVSPRVREAPSSDRVLKSVPVTMRANERSRDTK
jgi:hypothetical protein